MIGRQQMLHGIVREGQQMMAESSAKNKKETEKKLQLLQKQWESLVTRAQQRKNELDRLVAQWLIYRNQKDRLEVGSDTDEDLFSSKNLCFVGCQT